MKLKVYNFLVNRHGGIRSRYHKIHDNGGSGWRLFSYIYLIFLNFCYYFLFCHFLGKEEIAVYEEKRLSVSPESGERSGQKMSVEDFADHLSQYDVISFDIFDTMIFRPFSDPTDLFYFLDLRLGMPDMKRLRTEQEALARRKCFLQRGHSEVTFAEIWECMERETGVSAAQGMEAEQELEMTFCYANPFIYLVFEELRARGKKIIGISDMYLPEAFLRGLLKHNGYEGLDALYVSCEYGRSKGEGTLYEFVREQFPPRTKLIHVGDNEHNDVKMAQRNGFATLHYPNVNRMALSYRAYDLSPLIGGAYRGIVDNHLYQGGRSYSVEYEYGFVYGGLFVMGYCHFIHEYCVSHGIEKLLFLSRDGDILKQVYDGMYPEDRTSYVYWSRTAATKLMAEFNSYDYFRRYLYHKVNQGLSIQTVLAAMELEFLLEKLSADANVEDGSEQAVLRPDEELTDRNVELLKSFIQAHYSEVCALYREQQEAARAYYERELEGIKRAAAIDIGWAGSGALSLSYLVERVWRMPCQICGIVAGTNTVHNVEPDAAESHLQAGKLTAYLFSQSHNRDVMKRHDPGKDYNVYWELLLSSPERQFLGFGFEEGLETDIYSDNGKKVRLRFGKEDANQEGIRDIQKGIRDFVTDYRRHFLNEPFMFAISGRDACAPMLLASGHHERYLREIAKRFALDKGL